MDTDQILLEQFVTKYPAQAAQAIESLKDEDVVAFIEEIPRALSTELISQMKAYRAANCLQLVKPALAKELIEQMDIATAEAVLRHCEIPFRSNLLNNVISKRAKVLSQKLKYRADTVGAWMTPKVFALNKDTLVEDAIAMVKQEKGQVFSTIHVIDEEDKLVGNIKLLALFFAGQARPLAAIMNTEIPKIFADVLIKSIQNHPGWYEYLALPVVDRSEKLIGILDVESCQKSNTEASQEQTKEVLETSSALGELYRIGLTGFLQSLSK